MSASKLVEIKIILEVTTADEKNEDKLAKTFVDDAIGEVGRIHKPWYGEDLVGQIEVRQVKIGNWG